MANVSLQISKGKQCVATAQFSEWHDFLRRETISREITHNVNYRIHATACSLERRSRIQNDAPDFHRRWHIQPANLDFLGR